MNEHWKHIYKTEDGQVFLCEGRKDSIRKLTNQWSVHRRAWALQLDQDRRGLHPIQNLPDHHKAPKWSKEITSQWSAWDLTSNNLILDIQLYPLKSWAQINIDLFPGHHFMMEKKKVNCWRDQSFDPVA